MSESTIVVKIGRIGSPVKEVVLQAGATVQDALTAAGENVTNCTLKLRGQDITTSSVIGDGSLITILPNVKNG